MAASQAQAIPLQSSVLFPCGLCLCNSPSPPPEAKRMDGAWHVSSHHPIESRSHCDNPAPMVRGSGSCPLAAIHLQKWCPGCSPLPFDRFGPCHLRWQRCMARRLVVSSVCQSLSSLDVCFSGKRGLTATPPRAKWSGFSPASAHCIRILPAAMYSRRSLVYTRSFVIWTGGGGRSHDGLEREYMDGASEAGRRGRRLCSARQVSPSSASLVACSPTGPRGKPFGHRYGRFRTHSLCSSPQTGRGGVPEAS